MNEKQFLTISITINYEKSRTKGRGRKWRAITIKESPVSSSQLRAKWKKRNRRYVTPY